MREVLGGLVWMTTEVSPFCHASLRVVTVARLQPRGQLRFTDFLHLRLLSL